MLTTEVTVTDLPEEKKEPGMPAVWAACCKHPETLPLHINEGPREFFSRAFFFFTGNTKTIGKA